MRSREEDAAIISKNLKRLLSEKGATQTELAKAIHENATTVNMWFLGKSIPRFSKFMKIAEYFGCKVSDITESKELFNTDLALNQDEYWLVMEYRRLEQTDKEMIRRMIAYSQIGGELREHNQTEKRIQGPGD